MMVQRGRASNNNQTARQTSPDVPKEDVCAGLGRGRRGGGDLPVGGRGPVWRVAVY